MNDKIIHDLAVAYAQIKLNKEQLNTNYNSDYTNDEIRSFLKSYHFALVHIPEENERLDLSALY